MAKTRLDDDQLRTQLIDAAIQALSAPDPLAQLKVSEIAKEIGESESTILYNVDTPPGIDTATGFRRQAYVRAIEMFDTELDHTVYDTTTEALGAGQSLTSILAELFRTVTLQFGRDPACRLLLGVVVRTNNHSELAAATAKAWSTFSGNVNELVDLTLAGTGHRLRMAPARRAELVQIAVVAGWIQQEFFKDLDGQSVQLDGGSFEQAGLVFWSGIRKDLQTRPATTVAAK